MSEYKFPDLATLRLAKLVANERGVPVDDLLKELEAKIERTSELRKSRTGKYSVIGLDKFDNEDWVHGEYDTAKEAVEEARKRTKEERRYASDSSVATVYYAYDPSGRYLGGE